MVMHNSRLAYIDCYEIMERAMANGKGCRVKFKDLNECFSFRSRMHYARRVNREDNAKVYGPDEPLHGRSAFDRLIISISPTDDGGGYVYVKVSATENLIVEDLDGELKPNVGSHGESQGDIEEGRGRGQSQAAGGKGLRRF